MNLMIAYRRCYPLVTPSCCIGNISICTMNSEQPAHRSIDEWRNIFVCSKDTSSSSHHRLSSAESIEECLFAIHLNRRIIRSEGFFRKSPLAFFLLHVFFIDHFTVGYLLYFFAIFAQCIRVRTAVTILILELIVASSRTKR
jgi:hypothetical protein